ncbi:hypothetical protein WAI453_008613 [Rhynchosporium graminicola]
MFNTEIPENSAVSSVETMRCTGKDVELEMRILDLARSDLVLDGDVEILPWSFKKMLRIELGEDVWYWAVVMTWG